MTDTSTYLPGEHWEEVDRICDEFERQFDREAGLRLEPYLAALPSPASSRLFSELFELEIELRQKAGEIVSLGDYEGRFLQYQAELKQAFERRHGIVATAHFARATSQVSSNCPSATSGLIPESIGNYEILEEHARGGMGIVYRARQKGLARIVALKTIRSGQLANAEEIRRFYTEAQAAARLEHSNIVRVYDVGTAGNQHFLSMAFIQGESLQERVINQPLDNREAASIVRGIANGVGYAHRLQVIHRDLKPHNILLDESNQPLVTDFGLAKIIESDSDLTHTGQVMGTPSYMSPEQARGDSSAIGPATDIYAIGGILYFVLTGRPPFQSASVADILRQVLTKEPVSLRKLNSAVDSDLETICLKCLEKDVSRRYHSANEVAEELQRYLDGRPIIARPLGLGRKTWRWSLRNPVLAFFVMLASTLMLSAFALGPLAAWRFSRLAGQEAALRQDAEQARAQLASALDKANEQTQLADQQRREAEIQTNLIESVNNSIEENALEVGRFGRVMELLAAQHAYDIQDYGQLNKLVEQFHRAGLPIEPPQSTFLHQYWRRLVGIGSSPFRKVVIDPAGKVLAICTSEYLEIRQLPSNQLIARLRLPYSDTPRLAWHPDGRRLVASDSVGNVVLFSYEQPTKKTLLGAALGPVESVECSPQGDEVLILGDAMSRSAWVYHLKQHAIRKLTLPAEARRLRWIGQGAELLFQSTNGEARILDALSGNVVDDLTALNERKLRCAAASESGREIIAGDERGTVWLWDRLLQRLRSLPIAKHTLADVRFAGHQRILAGTIRGRVVLWNLTKELPELEWIIQGSVLAVDCSRNAEYIWVDHFGSQSFAYGLGRTGQPSCRYWSPAIVPSHRRYAVTGIRSADWLEPSRLLVQAKEGLRELDLITGSLMPSSIDSAAAALLGESPEGIEVDGAQLRFTDPTNGGQRLLCAQDANIKYWHTWRDEDFLVTVDEHGSMIGWAFSTGTKHWKSPAMQPLPYRFAFSADKAIIASQRAGPSCILDLVDARGGEILETQSFVGNICCFAFSRDSSRLLGGGTNGVFFWRVSQGNDNMKMGIPVGKPRLKAVHHAGLLSNCMATSPDGSLVAFGRVDGAIDIWSIEDETRTATLSFCNEPVLSLRFSDDSSALIAISETAGLLGLWQGLSEDVSDQPTLATLESWRQDLNTNER